MNELIDDAGHSELDRLTERIRQHYKNMPKKLQEIANFALVYPETMALSTLSDLEARTAINSSAFVRFAKNMDFAGFSQLQAVYKQSLKSQWSNYSSRISQLDTLSSDESFEALSGAAAQSILTSHQQIDRTRLNNAIAMLRQAKMIWLIGNGRSMAAMSYLSYMLTRMGIKNQTISPAPQLAFDQLEFVGEGEVIFATSFAPYSELTISLITQARKQNINILSITDTKISPLYDTNSLLVVESAFQGFKSISATISLCQHLAIETGRVRA